MGGTRRSKESSGARLQVADIRRESRLAVAAEVSDEEAMQQVVPELLQTIESEIIPRLMLAHRVDLGPALGGTVEPSTCTATRPAPTDDEIAEFARIATCHDLSSAIAFVETICREGVPLESILLDLIAPTARLLGEQWKEDLRSFTEVSAGLGTLQQLVHVLGPSFAPATPHRGLVVLAVAPGEQHTLGVFVVGEFLRRAGWGVQVSATMSEDQLVTMVATEHVEMVGFSVSNTDLLRALGRLIGTIRGASRNRNLTVMVGGPLDLQEFANRHGLVLCAGDPREAVRWLELHGKSGR